MEGRHEFKSTQFGAALGLLAGGLKILTVFDEARAERPHRAVFLDRIAVRHIDGHRHAITAPRKGEALAVVAPGGRDQSSGLRPLALQAINIDEPATHLEGADRGVVLMLDDSRRAEPFRQQWPR